LRASLSTSSQTFVVADVVPDSWQVFSVGLRDCEGRTVRQPVFGKLKRDALVESDDLLNVVEEADQPSPHFDRQKETSPTRLPNHAPGAEQEQQHPGFRLGNVSLGRSVV
jgi:hypothetical protein